MNKHDIVMQVRELLSRSLSVDEIASRLHMDPFAVQQIVETIRNLLT